MLSAAHPLPRAGGLGATDARHQLELLTLDIIVKETTVYPDEARRIRLFLDLDGGHGARWPSSAWPDTVRTFLGEERPADFRFSAEFRALLEAILAEVELHGSTPILPAMIRAVRGDVACGMCHTDLSAYDNTDWWYSTPMCPACSVDWAERQAEEEYRRASDAAEFMSRALDRRMADARASLQRPPPTSPVPAIVAALIGLEVGRRF